MLRTVFRYLLSVFFIYAGFNHLRSPEPFVAIMPRILPWPYALVAISGWAEIIGGLGVILAQTRRIAGWGLIALLIAVFPANIQAAIHGMELGGKPVAPWILWVRLPFQFIFIAWVYWTCELGKRKTPAEKPSKITNVDEIA
ncbi:DoxX family protein [Singulisphaera sp. PoT]|uniref:DoxX family protein n=1 Tax=Singulisphaera sp. PoT TaxID=3411797 RepID=UPI003BF48829